MAHNYVEKWNMFDFGYFGTLCPASVAAIGKMK